MRIFFGSLGSEFLRMLLRSRAATIRHRMAAVFNLNHPGTRCTGTSSRCRCRTWWLCLYTFWYQIKPFSTSANADILVMTVMAVLSLAFVLIPFIPGVRDIPRWIPLYKLIWRDYYRTAA